MCRGLILEWLKRVCWYFTSHFMHFAEVSLGLLVSSRGPRCDPVCPLQNGLQTCLDSHSFIIVLNTITVAAIGRNYWIIWDFAVKTLISWLRRQKLEMKIIMAMCKELPQQMLNEIIMFLWFSIHDLIRFLKVFSTNNIIIAPSSHAEKASIFLWILGNHIKYWLYCWEQGSSGEQTLTILPAKSWKASG